MCEAGSPRVHVAWRKEKWGKNKLWKWKHKIKGDSSSETGPGALSHQTRYALWSGANFPTRAADRPFASTCPAGLLSLLLAILLASDVSCPNSFRSVTQHTHARPCKHVFSGVMGSAGKTCNSTSVLGLQITSTRGDGWTKCVSKSPVKIVIIINNNDILDAVRDVCVTWSSLPTCRYNSGDDSRTVDKVSVKHVLRSVGMQRFIFVFIKIWLANPRKLNKYQLTIILIRSMSSGIIKGVTLMLIFKTRIFIQSYSAGYLEDVCIIMTLIIDDNDDSWVWLI